MSLKNSIKDNVVAPYNKYNSYLNNKVGEVLKVDKKANTCTIVYKNSNGIMQIEENAIYRQSSSTGFLDYKPKKGDYVELEEEGNVVRIIGAYKKKIVEEMKENNDTYAGSSDYGGNLGI